MSSFKKATKEQAKARIALIGPAGSGKTMTALRLAKVFGKRIAVIDSEHGTAAKYSDKFDFDHCELTSFAPRTYVEKIHEAEEAGYDVIVVDSLSHAWAGKDGALEQVDKIAARNKGNSFNAWGTVTPEQNAFVEALCACKAHLIVTVRQKMEYVQEKDDRGKTSIKKVGMKPVQRDGLEYEFDIVCDLDVENTLYVTKTRCDALKRAVVPEPGEAFGKTILAWLSDGTPATVRAKSPAAAPASPEQASTPFPDAGAPPPADVAPLAELPAAKPDGQVLDELCDRIGHAATLAEIDAAVAEAKKLPSDHPALPTLRLAVKARKRELAAAQGAAA